MKDCKILTELATQKVNYINEKIIDFLSKYERSVIYGQNIVSGSRISGLGKNLQQIKNCLAMNTPNSESSLFGIGFGLSMNSVPSVFLMKQHDFALLGLDQLTNTYNLVKNNSLNAPIIIFMVVVDSGFEGPQASLNNLDDFASLTRAKVHYLTTKENIEKTFKEISTPDLHFVVVGQSSLKSPLLSSNDMVVEYPNSILYKSNSKDQKSNTIVINFGVNTDLALQTISILSPKKLNSDLLLINKIGDLFTDTEKNSIREYNNIIIIEGSKSQNKFSEKLFLSLIKLGCNVFYFPRIENIKWSGVNSDKHEVTSEDILREVTKNDK